MAARRHNDLGLRGSRIHHRVVIEEHRLDDDWRRHRTGFDLLRIDHHEAFGSGKPQTTIGCFAAGRLEAGRTGEGRHANRQGRRSGT